MNLASLLVSSELWFGFCVGLGFRTFEQSAGEVLFMLFVLLLVKLIFLFRCITLLVPLIFQLSFLRLPFPASFCAFDVGYVGSGFDPNLNFSLSLQDNVCDFFLSLGLQALLFLGL
ncbi:hypothetical protein KC19_9G067600 [Ceratodon purpureus]|uniref:Uncharacterized protein n=1 Tax=Ceratodon purpureus TaxID=3225 RepID=A0A8T0GPF7_CERPU|nr:hypothetical protein KC19_9G067600 [Ceratodon purpureus]